MLRELAVRDLALIERVRVVFEPGLTVVTGETGAGKSLLIDALGLVMGARADSSMVRHGAPGARVEAILETDDATLICVREVSAEGRSLARLDDETVTAGRLAAVVGPLIEVHGQHEQQRLLSAAWQRDVLDAFGGHAALRAQVAKDVQALRANEAALRELAIEPAEMERRLELAEHAAEEIESGRAARRRERRPARAAGSASAMPRRSPRCSIRRTTSWPERGARRAIASRRRRTRWPSWRASIRQPPAWPNARAAWKRRRPTSRSNSAAGRSR